jgi:hypothetical protein
MAMFLGDTFDGVTGSFFMEDVSDLGESLFDAVVLFDV